MKNASFAEHKRIAAFILIILLFVWILSACTSNASPTPIPTIVLSGGNADEIPESASGGEGVVASAVVVPEREAHLAFVIGGNIAAVHVKVGDHVKAGQVLMELENHLAQLEVERAKRALRELTSPAMIAAAEEALASAQKELEEAQNNVSGLFYPRASDALIDKVKAEITLAEEQLAMASDTYRHFARRPDGDPQKAAALLALTNAQLNLNALRAKYNWYTGKPSETDIAIAQARLSAAQAAVQEAQWYLAALKGESVPPEASGAKLAQLQQARDDLAAAQARLEQTRLVAPFDGVISQINSIAGEYAVPGQILIIVSDLEHLQVRTTDLSERDVVRIKVGDPALITINALNQDFHGKVISISPLANLLGGDVVYEVTVAFEEQPHGALAGMTADVIFEESE